MKIRTESEMQAFTEYLNIEHMREFKAVERTPARLRPLRTRCFWCDRQLKVGELGQKYLCWQHYPICRSAIEEYDAKQSAKTEGIKDDKCGSNEVPKQARKR